MLPPILACVLGLELLLGLNTCWAQRALKLPLSPPPGAPEASSFYSIDPKIPPPVPLLPPGFPLPLPSANDDVEAERAGFDLQLLPPSLMDFPASDTAFPSLVTVCPDSSFRRSWCGCAWKRTGKVTLPHVPAGPGSGSRWWLRE